MKLIGVDVGGTFTDLIITDTGTKNTHIHKVPTTPDDPSVGVTRGILELCKYSNVLANQIDHVFHGTTIATNAVLEYEGSETGSRTLRPSCGLIRVHGSWHTLKPPTVDRFDPISRDPDFIKLRIDVHFCTFW